MTTEQSSYNFRAAAVVWFVVGIVEIFIAARFLGKLFGASAQSAFVNFMYQVSGPMVAPLQGSSATPARGQTLLRRRRSWRLSSTR